MTPLFDTEIGAPSDTPRYPEMIAPAPLITTPPANDTPSPVIVSPAMLPALETVTPAPEIA